MRLNTVLRYGILAGLFAIPLFIPFIVSKTMFFPFITGKNFTFRIIVEIIFAGWLLLALRDVAYRLKFSWIAAAVFFFLGAVTVADIFGEDFLRSFWSNFERMDGLITLLHLVLLFVVAASVLNTRALWERLLQISLAASVLMSFYAILQLVGKVVINQGGVRVDALLGNATYFGGYLLLHIFIAAFLFARERAPVWLRSVYGAAIALHIFMLFNTMTRGAILALFGGAALVALFLAFRKTEGGVMRRYALGILVALILLVSGFTAIKDTEFVRGNQILDRLSGISLEAGKSRFLVWSIAWEGFKERPILGWGQDNYIIAFSKHYKSEMYSEEPWFDRAHNIAFDWLIAGGALGLLSYLLIFAALGYALWIYPRRAGSLTASPQDSGGFSLSYAERSVLTGLFAAYLFHNLFVFDNVVSYFFFFFFLALVHQIAVGPLPSSLRFLAPLGRLRFRDTHKNIWPAFVFFFLVIALYFLNIQGMLGSRALLKAIDMRSVQGATSQEAREVALRERLIFFKKALAAGHLGRMEAREQLTQAANVLADAPVSQLVKQEFFSLAQSEMEKQIRETPGNLRPRMFLASLLVRYRLFDDAVLVIEDSFKVSDKKQDVYLLLSNAYFNGGHSEKALEVAMRAFDLEPRNDKVRRVYGSILIRTGNVEKAESLFAENGSGVISDPEIANAYASVGRHDKRTAFWEEQIRQNPQNLQAYISLSASYLEWGKRGEAVGALERAIGLFSDFETQGEYLIREIEAGRNP